MKRLPTRLLQAVLYSLAVILLTITFLASLNAQIYRGGISGTVTDSTDAAVVGAAVSAVDTATSLSYKTVSSSSGEFNFTNLPLGNYTVTISYTGFSTAKYDKVQVAAGPSYTLSAKLALSSTEQTVEVTAAALTLDTETDCRLQFFRKRSCRICLIAAATLPKCSLKLQDLLDCPPAAAHSMPV
jgi:hypothetical protein